MIVILEGPMGSGKTISAIALAAMEKAKSGKRILSNVHLKEIDHQFFDMNDFIRMVGVDNNDIHDCSIILDEAYAFIDARNSQSSLNKLLSYMVMQSRMRAVDMYITTQNIDLVDKRLRRSCDVRGICRYNRDRQTCTIMLTDLRSGVKRRVQINANDFFDYIPDESIIMRENPMERILENINYNRAQEP